MPLLKNIIDFSSNGEYLAYSSPDGCLKIWETSTNILTQEYTPSSHLSATCSALSWCPNVNTGNPSKKSKKSEKNVNFSAIKELQLIAMGTLTGDILLYSYQKADLYTCLSNGHSNIVNDLCWCISTCSLYSCSNDSNIVVWDIFTGTIKTKWKADGEPVYSLCLIDEDNLLSASNTIKWWNIKQKSIVKTFLGHATEVFRLLPVNKKMIDNPYFLSAAVGDKIISAWQLSIDSSKKVASFIVSDEPESLSAFTQNDGTTFISVVCKDGSLHLFERVLNGPKKKPMHPKFSIQIASKSKEPPSKPQKIPILSSTLSSGLTSCLLSYGSSLKPIFERIDLSEVSTDLFLVRNISLFSTESQQDDITRIKRPNKSESVKLLVPGHLMPVKDVLSIPLKRKKKGDNEEELPMEERLRALDLSKIPPNLQDQEPALKADSMVHLLLQGLQSKDNNLINTVLQTSDEIIIENTLKRLPLPSIISLLKELQIRLCRKDQRNHSNLKWMKSLLSVHLPYLMSCKDIIEYLAPINKIIAARIENFPKMCQLQGSLKILLSQTSSSNVKKSERDLPLTVYESDSSGESEEEVDHSANSSEAELHQDLSCGDSSESDSDSESDMEL